MPGTIGDPRLAVPRRRLRKLRERLMPSQRTLIVLAREHIRVTSAAALVKKIIFIILFMCSCAYSICVLLYFIAFRISIPLLISRLRELPGSSSDEKRSGFIGVVAYEPRRDELKLAAGFQLFRIFCYKSSCDTGIANPTSPSFTPSLNPRDDVTGFLCSLRQVILPYPKKKWVNEKTLGENSREFFSGNSASAI